MKGDLEAGMGTEGRSEKFKFRGFRRPPKNRMLRSPYGRKETARRQPHRPSNDDAEEDDEWRR